MEFGLDEENTKLTVNPGKQFLTLEVIGLHLDFAMDFAVLSKPSWLKDSGAGSIAVDRCDMRLNLHPYAQDGVLQVDFSEVQIDIRSYKAELDGHSDLSKALEILLNNFETFFKNELTNVLAWRAAKSAEKSLNSMLLSLGDSVDLAPGWALNTNLVGDPILRDDFVAFPLDGSFVRIGAGEAS